MAERRRAWATGRLAAVLCIGVCTGVVASASVATAEPNPPPVNPVAVLSASDGAANDGFGSSVAVFNSTAVVGAPDHAVDGRADEGVVYIFTKAGTKWKQAAELTPSDGGAGDHFGTAVGMSGSTVLVGAPGHQVGANPQQGAAYEFVKDGATWSQTEIVAPDGAAGDAFGTSVAIASGSIVIGSPHHQDGANSDEGAAYLFAKSGRTWKQQAELTGQDSTTGDEFGTAVAASDTTVLVGAPLLDFDGLADEGAAYVFNKSGTHWDQVAELTNAYGTLHQGASVAIDGATLVVGAPVSPDEENGSAFVYGKTTKSDVEPLWQQEEEIFGQVEGDDAFGTSVALSSSTIVCGAPDFTDNGGQTDMGTAFSFGKLTGLNDTWTPGAQLNSPAVANNVAGTSVAVSNSMALMGVPNDQVGANPDQGIVNVYNTTEIRPVN
jgi:hypothetical protein